MTSTRPNQDRIHKERFFNLTNKIINLFKIFEYINSKVFFLKNPSTGG